MTCYDEDDGYGGKDRDAADADESYDDDEEDDDDDDDDAEGASVFLVLLVLHHLRFVIVSIVVE